MSATQERGARSAITLMDVLDRIFDKGIVIDSWQRVSPEGISMPIPTPTDADPVAKLTEQLQAALRELDALKTEGRARPTRSSRA